jgi:HNH endonuclease/Homing endonuclease associated repeat
VDFTFHRHRTDKLTPARVLPLLKEAAKRHGFTLFGKRDFDKLRLGVSAGGVCNAFGSWNNAIVALRKELDKEGHSLTGRPGPGAIPEADLLGELERVWRHLGHRPSRSEWESANPRFHYGTYRNRFGGWSKACLSFLESRMGTQVTLRGPGESVGVDAPELAPHLPSQNLTARSRNPSDRLRLRVLDRDGFRCVLCGSTPALDRQIRLHLDHVKPFSQGGLTTYDNLRTLCSACNQGRGALAELG